MDENVLWLNKEPTYSFPRSKFVQNRYVYSSLILKDYEEGYEIVFFKISNIQSATPSTQWSFYYPKFFYTLSSSTNARPVLAKVLPKFVS